MTTGKRQGRARIKKVEPFFVRFKIVLTTFKFERVGLNYVNFSFKNITQIRNKIKMYSHLFPF